MDVTDLVDMMVQAFWPSGSLEQLRRELIEVVAPVDPGVGAGRFDEHGIETMPLQHGHGAAGSFNHEVVLARGEPQELETFLQFGVVERILVSFLPSRTAGCVRHAASASAKGS